MNYHMASTALPLFGAMSNGSVMFARPLVNSIVAGLLVGYSFREQMLRMLARSHLARMAPNPRESACIGWQSRSISGPACMDSYGAIPFSVKRQALALTAPSSLCPTARLPSQCLPTCHGLLEEVIVDKDNLQHALDVVFHNCLPDFREEDLQCSCGFKLIFCHLELGQEVIVFPHLR